MNYYEHHMGDYMRDTVQLSMLEDGAYRRLLDAYYVREKPLPTDIKECLRLARATSKPEREAVAYVLKEFFECQEDGYHQARADAEIAHFQDKSAKSKAAAKERWSGRVSNGKRTGKQYANGHADAYAGAYPDEQPNADTIAEPNASPSADANGDAGGVRHARVPHTPYSIPQEVSERSFPARDARIATTVPTEPPLARAPALSEPQVNPKPPTAMPDLETDMAKAYAAVMQIGITGIGPGDPRLRALLVQGATVEEIKGVALQGARSSRSSWAWVSAAVEGKRKDAARINLAPGPPVTTPNGREPVFNGGAPPPEETPERRAARLARAGFLKTPDQLATETLAALQAKRGTDFPTHSDRDDA